MFSDGLALQRLIKSLKCNFLALSATVGNAEQLRTWMENVRGEQINAEAVTVRPHGADRSDSEVVMEVHEGRFINLQRHVWTAAAEVRQKARTGGPAGDFDLLPLHPLSAVSLEFLRDGGFSKSSLPMTPQDSYTLWTNLNQCFGAEHIAHLNPHIFFAGSDRITLLKTKVNTSLYSFL